ncbi:hypothetical protein CRE_23049 [Caenorhabditis remanei]|uniref:Uncharacterized protein n=1 Tax=Caenorhabditis remanei TaxID=31234 RepID=E3N9D5_CAERE|nr:hypothetical protein CRE_23049 [Caenorhabditis remanei]
MFLENIERYETLDKNSSFPFAMYSSSRKSKVHGLVPGGVRMDLSIDKTDFENGKVYLKGIKCTEMSEETKNDVRNYRDRRLDIHLIVLH